MKSAIAASGMLAATMGNVSYFIDLLTMIICSICSYHFICFYFRMYFNICSYHFICFYFRMYFKKLYRAVGQNVCLPSGSRTVRVPSIGQ